ncbi:MAG: LysR family transcriptional regulator [Clostridiales bacterium]|nr:LysR family transcriptional regulator [Clostridiales bacterium]
MNIHHLRCAVMVARHGSQTRAAEVLYMSQPNLSKALKDLEQACGFRIFSRTGAGMIPTRKGEEFLLRARAVLEQMDAMDAIYQGHNRTTAYLSVAIPRASYISNAVTEFVNSLEPSCAMELNIRETNTAGVVHEVLAREVDIGIVRYSVAQQNKVLGDLAEQGLNYILYWKFKPLVLMSKKHPLARKKSITKAELLPYIEISHGDTAQPIHMDESQAEIAEQRQIRVYERGSQFDLLSQSPATYMWVSPVPKGILDRQALVQIACDEVETEYQDALIYLRGYTMSKWEQSFCDFVRKEVQP